MELVDLDVALGGDVRMIVCKSDVSIAELVVLQAIHGRGAISNVKLVGRIKNFNPSAHFDVLRERYELSETSPRLAEMFPGVPPQMPRALAEVVLTDPEDSTIPGSTSDGEVVRFDSPESPADADDDGDDDSDFPEPPPLDDLPEGVDSPDQTPTPFDGV